MLQSCQRVGISVHYYCCRLVRTNADLPRHRRTLHWAAPGHIHLVLHANIVRPSVSGVGHSLVQIQTQLPPALVVFFSITTSRVHSGVARTSVRSTRQHHLQFPQTRIFYITSGPCTRVWMLEAAQECKTLSLATRFARRRTLCVSKMGGGDRE